MPASSLHSDPAFRPLIDEFVTVLPVRLDRLQEALRESDREETRRLAHQLKGAGGGYGFSRVSAFAGEVERLAEPGSQIDELSKAVDRLVSECDQAIAQWSSGEGVSE